MAQGFKMTKASKKSTPMATKKNKPQKKKVSSHHDKAHKLLSGQIAANNETSCASKVLQSKQHLKLVKSAGGVHDASKGIRKH
jgi:hypothetical protein